MWIILACLRGVRESLVLVGGNKSLRVGDGDWGPTGAAKQIKQPSPVQVTEQNSG
jgi:hypothetical protein